MANYVCSKCGQKAMSKCIHNRNLFIDYENQNVFFVSTMITVTDKEIKIELPDNKENITDWIYHIAKLAKEYPQAICSHDWQCISDSCMFGCCKKE